MGEFAKIDIVHNFLTKNARTNNLASNPTFLCPVNMIRVKKIILDHYFASYCVLIIIGEIADFSGFLNCF